MPTYIWSWFCGAVHHCVFSSSAVISERERRGIYAFLLLCVSRSLLKSLPFGAVVNLRLRHFIVGSCGFSVSIIIVFWATSPEKASSGCAGRYERLTVASSTTETHLNISKISYYAYQKSIKICANRTARIRRAHTTKTRFSRDEANTV